MAFFTVFRVVDVLKLPFKVANSQTIMVWLLNIFTQKINDSVIIGSSFFLYLHGMSETGKKFRIITISLKKMRILVILGHFWPVPFRECVFKGLFEYILTSSEWTEWDWQKIWKNDNKVENNANFGHFRPFLACFWPSSAWNEWDWQKNSE